MRSARSNSTVATVLEQERPLAQAGGLFCWASSAGDKAVGFAPNAFIKLPRLMDAHTGNRVADPGDIEVRAAAPTPDTILNTLSPSPMR